MCSPVLGLSDERADLTWEWLWRRPTQHIDIAMPAWHRRIRRRSVVVLCLKLVVCLVNRLLFGW